MCFSSPNTQAEPSYTYSVHVSCLTVDHQNLTKILIGFCYFCSFMACDKVTSLRFCDDFGLEPERRRGLKFGYQMNGKHAPKTLQEKIVSRVFSEEFKITDKMILDPRGPVINKWNKIFLVACLVSLFIDPLYFYLPEARKEACLQVSMPLAVVLTVVRSVVDAFYFIQIFVRFHTAIVAPSSRVFGTGELIIDPSKVALKYLYKDFCLDVFAALPVPQVLVWAIIPNIQGSAVINAKNIIRFIILLQYFLRLYLTYPLSSQIINATGFVIETAWAGAAYNLMLFMLASHVLGSSWYLLSVERVEECWRKACSIQQHCQRGYFECHSLGISERKTWFASSNISELCKPSSDFIQFGIYADALIYGVTFSRFFNKYFYCLWWGLRNLSSLGQNLYTTKNVGEINFAIIIAILGLVLFALLIGNMQTYLQSTTIREEEWRIRRTDTELWMHHRKLPRELKQNVRKYDQYRWAATHGVNEECVLGGLPLDLRRDIKRHLCLDLVRKVPLFDEMDDRMLDAICERLKPSLCTKGTCLAREGDPLSEMLFIIRGRLDSYTTNGGRTGFLNSCCIGPGDFCGEELLPWALDARPNIVLPTSTRTVRSLNEVEAFALIAEDLKFVASQFRRLNSKQLRHTFRFHSHQWRTWSACFIQAAWFRYKRLKEAAEMEKMESLISSRPVPVMERNKSLPTSSSSSIVFTQKLVVSTRWGGSKRFGSKFDILSPLQKPVEPDFSVEDRQMEFP